MRKLLIPRRQRADARIGTRGLLGAAALAAMAAFVALKTRQAEQRHPPAGSFIDVGGTRLHYIERGSGEPLLLLHGNGATARELELSGLVDQLAGQYRVFAFDRPGYGYSQPLGRDDGPEAQAALFHQALAQLGLQPAVVVGHSWGTLVAISLALAHPEQVRRLVLMSGYYFPLPRLDALMMVPPALPVVGVVLRHTLSPLLGRLAWPLLLKKIFSPAPIPRRFRSGYPAWMTLRPSQLRSSAREAVAMMPAAARLSARIPGLTLPVTIITGAEDRQVRPRHHAHPLHEALRNSELVLMPGAGHMVHHTATAQVVAAIASAGDRLAVPVPGMQPVRAAGDPSRIAAR